MNLAPGKSSAVYFAVFAAVTGLFGALAPIAGGAVGELFRGMVLYDGIILLADIRLLFLTSTVLRLLSLVLIRFIATPETVSVTQLFASTSKIQTFLPLYQIQSVAASGMGAVENITTGLTKGVISVEAKIDRLLDRGIDLSKAAVFKARSIDRQIDDKLTQHEENLEQLVDKIAARLRRKK